MTPKHTHQPWRIVARCALAIVFGSGIVAHAACPPVGDPTKPLVPKGKLCSAQTGSCEAGLACVESSGCHCMEVDDTTPTTRPTTTTTRATVSTTTTRTGSTLPGACAETYKQCNLTGTQVLPCCRDTDECVPGQGVSTTYCTPRTGTTAAPPTTHVATTTLRPTTLAPTTTVTTPPPPPTAVPTTTLHTTTTLPAGCAETGKQCNLTGSQVVPCCRATDDCVAGKGVSTTYCTTRTGTTVVPPTTIPATSTTTVRVPTTTSTTMLGAPCGLRGKACGGQYGPCCSGLDACMKAAGSARCEALRQLPLQSGLSRSTPIDRSVRIQANENLLYASRGSATSVHTANQDERDELEWQLVKDVIDYLTLVEPGVNAQGLVFSPGAPHCAAAINGCRSNSGGLGKILGGLGPAYETRALCRDTCTFETAGSLWQVAGDGNHYSDTIKCINDIKTCLLADPLDCGRRLAGNQPALDQLDMYLDAGGRCVHGAPYVLAKPPPFDTARDDQAPINPKMLVVVPAHHQPALHMTHTAHEVAIAQCLGRPLTAEQATAPPVSIAHVRYEALCGSDANCLHFRRMKPFGPACSSRWTAAQCCTWKQITHAFHERWMQCQLRGDWACTREADTDHFIAHACMNRGDDGTDVLFSCGTGDSIPDCQWPNGQKGPMTCGQFLPVVKGKLGVS